ncbi:type II toxin-antitoxin system PemK/MazF family toxin [Roseomonas sp. CCTCC AB2023176]|uniref:type II toxin-antitoxin system PemK/MazF family toxin n=1 Tax=Roseomonas sp. CCTCC AB2023176 TaxID=3342640 RepID=UPI0035E3B2A6
MFPSGTIFLTRFPFTDLSGDKRRPALVASRDNDRRADLVVRFVTSVPRSGPDIAPIDPTPGTGLKVRSVVRFDRIATLDRSVVAGALATAPPDWLAASARNFFDVFGLTPPATALA